MIKLNWSDERKPCDECRYNHVKIETIIFGNIYIEWKGWKDYPDYDCVISNQDGDIILICHEYSLDDAKRSVKAGILDLITEFNDDTTTNS